MTELRYDHLLGRPFKYGRSDCWALVREFYQDNFDIKFPNYAGPTDWWKIPGCNFMHETILKAGFRLVPEFNLRDCLVGDLLGINLMTEQVSHLGVYVGKGRVLHHAPTRPSAVEPLRGAALNRLTALYRHPAVRVDPGSQQTVDLMDLLPERTRRRLEALNEH